MLQSLQWLGIDTVRKRHSPITRQLQVPVALCIDNFRIELFSCRVRSDDGKQGALGQFGSDATS